MRKGFSVLSLVLFCISVKAQLYVNSSGHTMVGDYYNSDALFNVSSNDETSLSNLVSIESTNNYHGLQVLNYSPSSISNGIVSALTAFCWVYPYRDNCGVRSFALSGDLFNSGRSYGVLSKAGYAEDGWNFGVCTSLLGPHDGAGIFASTGNYQDGYQLTGRWAGYFDGNVKVVGNLTATTLTQTSDYRLKENISQLEGSSLDKLMGMNVVKYRLKNYEVNLGDTATMPHYAFKSDSPLLNSDHFGLIAQELEEIYPELVTEGEDGYLSINYIELIPILIKSVQELKAKVDALEGKPNNSPVRTGGTTQVTSQSAIQAALYQNSPNPFTENTTIRCIIPRSISKAVLYIYDMNGRQIDSMSIAERGDVSLTVEGSSLDAGIYMYSLITDGEVVDTKRLILTK